MNYKRKMQREARKRNIPSHCGRPMIEKMGHGLPHARLFICPRCGKIRTMSTLEEDTNKKNRKEPANDNSQTQDQ